jgi:hypothetical protein
VKEDIIFEQGIKQILRIPHLVHFDFNIKLIQGRDSIRLNFGGFFWREERTLSRANEAVRLNAALS